MKKLEQMKPAQRQKRIARLVKNPGTRSKIPEKYLPKEHRKQRALNTRLNSPVIEGSTVTGRDLARQRNTAISLKYGGQESQLKQQLGGLQQQEKDTGGWYDQYLAELRQHQSNQAQISAQSNQALQSFGGAVTGLDQAQINQTMQASAGEAAARGAAPSPVAAQEASQGSAVRQALLGSFGAMMASQGAGASSLADKHARVVGPGQKLTAQVAARGNVNKGRTALSDLAKEKGAFGQQFEGEFKQAEGKNVLAKQALGLDVAKATADVASDKAKASADKSKATLDQMNKDRKYRLDAQKVGATEAKDRYQRQHGLGPYKKTATKAKPGEKGPDWLAPGQTGAGLTQLQSLKSMAQRAKSGQPFEPGHAKQKQLDRHGAANKIKGFGPVASKLKDPILITAALDAVYDNHLSPATVKALIAAGYKPSRVAQTLGVPTAGKYKPAPKKKPRTPAQLIPGIGGN